MSISAQLPSLSLIACVARDGGIGFQNRLLWRNKQDMQRFRERTTGHMVLMGRLTWESLPAAFRPLPDRDNVVLTHNLTYQAAGARVVCSLDEALKPIATPTHSKRYDPSVLVPLLPTSKVFVMGGGQLYAALLPLATELLLTEVDAVFEADTFFPQWKRDEFEVTERERHRDESGVYFEFVTYRRR
jgi:dihydrofolate reductase